MRVKLVHIAPAGVLAAALVVVSVTGVPSSKDTRSGFAVNFAPGYEWRVARRFALGFQGDVVYLGIDGDLSNVFGYGLNAQFNWYW